MQLHWSHWGLANLCQLNLQSSIIYTFIVPISKRTNTSACGSLWAACVIWKVIVNTWLKYSSRAFTLFRTSSLLSPSRPPTGFGPLEPDPTGLESLMWSLPMWLYPFNTTELRTSSYAMSKSCGSRVLELVHAELGQMKDHACRHCCTEHFLKNCKSPQTSVNRLGADLQKMFSLTLNQTFRHLCFSYSCDRQSTNL